MFVGLAMRVRDDLIVVGTDTVVRNDVPQEIHARSADPCFFRSECLIGKP